MIKASYEKYLTVQKKISIFKTLGSRNNFCLNYYNKKI